MIKCSHTRVIPIEELVPNPRNPNTHPKSQIKLLAKILKTQGFRQAIVVSKRSGFIVKGHGRLESAKLAGLQQVPIDEQDYTTEAEEWADMIADNRIAELAETDNAILKDLIEELDTGENDLDLTGYDAEELDNLMSQFHQDVQEAEEDDFEVPNEIATNIVLGDLIEIGEHRLLCGDSTDSDAVGKLMNGDKADMVFTDPPYNLSFSGSMSNTTRDGLMIKHKGANQLHDAIHNDKMNPDEFYTFISDTLKEIKLNCNGAFYICFGSQTLNQLLQPFLDLGMEYKSIIIWMKNQATLSGKDYKGRYEPILYGRFNDAFYGERYKQEDIWEFQRTLKNDLHPTMKPIPLIENALNNSSVIGMRVLDLFLGSGSTMVASHQLKRKCYGMELDPKYCQVIIDRMKKLDSDLEIKVNGQPYLIC